MADHRLFCFGIGYSASRLAAQLLKKGWQVAGTVRDMTKARALQEMGMDVVAFTGDSVMHANGCDYLSSATHILSSVPPTDNGDPVLIYHKTDILAAPRVNWIGYLSTTGVYGDHNGAWVDENTPPSPVTERGKRRLAAERDWLALYENAALPVHIFRLAGIYGPGRNPLLSLKAGRAHRIAKPGHVFSRIHVDDIAQALQASMQRPHAGTIYNICDDLPASSSEVTAHAAKLLNMEAPPEVAFEDADISPMARSFYADNKRVSNRLLHEELGIRLRYPDYRAGLKALANELADDGR